MNTTNIILICIILFILYNLYVRMSEPFADVSPQEKVVKKQKEKLELDEVMDDIEEWERDNEPEVHFTRLNEKFVDSQYHQDYQDIINTFGLIVPTKRQIFNVSNRPLKYSEPQPAEANKIVLSFLQKLNEVVCNQVKMPEEPENSWATYQKSLDLPVLHEKENNNYKKLFLVGITKVRKYAIDDEVKYSVEFAIQKEGVKDQLLLKVDFVQDMKEFVNEDNLFKNKLPGQVRIEQIFKLGVLSNTGLYPNFNPEDKHYSFNEMEVNNMTDPKYVKNQLMKHYNKKMKEMEYRTAMLDENGRVFEQNVFDKIHRYPAYQTTQTIFDDFDGGVEYK